MGRVLPTPVAPPPPSGVTEFDRPRDYIGTTAPRDLARALGESNTFIHGIGETRVVTPDEQ